MTNEPAKTQNFEERMLTRFKEASADLLTSDEIKAMIEKHMNAVFFEQRKTTSGWHMETKPPLIEELVYNALADKVNAEIRIWLDNNKELLAKLVQDAISANMAQAMFVFLQQQLNAGVQQGMSAVVRQIQSGTLRAGS